MENVNGQLVTSLPTRNHVNTFPQGIQRGQSCFNCQFVFMNLVTQRAESHRLMLAIFFELSKAFGHVSHSRPLAKMRTYGIINQLCLGYRSTFLIAFRLSLLEAVFLSLSVLPVGQIKVAFLVFYYFCYK